MQCLFLGQKLMFLDDTAVMDVPGLNLDTQRANSGMFMKNTALSAASD
jgi:hypothetical protein